MSILRALGEEEPDFDKTSSLLLLLPFFSRGSAFKMFLHSLILSLIRNSGRLLSVDDDMYEE